MVLEIKNISKSFDNKLVLNNISMEFAEETRTAIMGPSGCGKTTFLYILLGLMKPDSGGVRTGKERFGCVFQEDRLLNSFDAISNVRIALSGETDLSYIKREFDSVGLTDYMNKPVSQLSGGMRRRVAIVRAMMDKNQTVVMDEPFKGLDEVLKYRVMDYVAEKLNGRRLILVTHSIEEAEYLGAEVIELQ